MQGVNSLIGGDMPVASTSNGDAPAAPLREGRGFGSTIAGFIGGRSNVVTDGSEWLVAVLVLLALLFLISLRVGGFTSLIVEG